MKSEQPNTFHSVQPEGVEVTARKFENPLRPRMLGRICYLRALRRVKDPELLEEALDAMEELCDTTRALLDDMGTPDDGMEANLMERCRSAIARCVPSPAMRSIREAGDADARDVMRNRSEK